MLSTSFEFRRKIAESSKVLVKATLTFADGTVRELTGDDVMMNGMSFDDAVSPSNDFAIGAAIMNRMSVTLNNHDGRFDECDFTGATIVPYVGVALDNGGVEWLRKGSFGVEQPDSYGGTIGLTCLDNMRLLERPYSEVGTAYPATLGTIVRDICLRCGVTLLTLVFANSGYRVAARPDDSALSCIDVLSYAAQVSGNFARFDNMGRLAVRWYDTTAFEGEDWLDGDRFDDATPYASGDTADGGTFLDYTSGDSYDGGPFTASKFILVHGLSSLTVSTDDVVITGVRVTAQDEVAEDGSRGRDGETALCGSEGYVLGIEGNPLVLYGQASVVAAQVGARVVGMRFRPFDASALGSPAHEAGDPVVVVDRQQRQHRAYVTSLTYRAGGYEALRCGAETPSRNSAASYSAATKAYVEMRNAVKNEKGARELAMEELARQLSESSGLYMTTEEQTDHSIVYYMHDKPTLRESQIVWKLTANAFGISTDGGVTYSYGLDVNGNAILNRIYAIGLNADYIQTGTLSSRNGNVSIDLDNGVMSASGASTLGGSSVSGILSDLSNAKSMANNTAALVRAYGSGVLVCKSGNTVGALVNANGSFDVVKVTWSNGVPTAGDVLATFSSQPIIGKTSGPHIKLTSTGFEVYHGTAKKMWTNLDVIYVAGEIVNTALSPNREYLHQGYTENHKTLYSSSSGSNSTITLNASAANYANMRIHYTCFGLHSSIMLKNPNGKSALLTGSDALHEHDIQLASARIAISGTSITWTYYRVMTMYDNEVSEYVTGNAFKITQVEAWNSFAEM